MLVLKLVNELTFYYNYTTNTRLMAMLTNINLSPHSTEIMLNLATSKLENSF